MTWRNKNEGKHPSDPDYDQDYDPAEDYERYWSEAEERFESERELKPRARERSDALGYPNSFRFSHISV